MMIEIAEKKYACGWLVDSVGNYSHSGSLPGTATEMFCAQNGYCWAILTNTRTWEKNFTNDMHELMMHAINAH